MKLVCDVAGSTEELHEAKFFVALSGAEFLAFHQPKS